MKLKYHSQKGQDEWVLSVLPKRNSFFLDVGAGDGMADSNTYALEKLGWKGICVEPNPMLFERLVKCRTCIVDNSVVSDRREEVPFRTDNGYLGGIVADDTDNNFGIRRGQLVNATIITLDAIPLTELLDRHNAPRIIDYFSLDVEGAEERTIRGLDLEKYQFRCLTIERPTPMVNEILLQNDYLFVQNIQFDSFYVHSSVSGVSCQPFEQVPPKDW